MHGTPKARYHTYVFRARHGKYFVSKQNKQKAYEAPVPGIIGDPQHISGGVPGTLHIVTVLLFWRADSLPFKVVFIVNQNTAILQV